MWFLLENPSKCVGHREWELRSGFSSLCHWTGVPPDQPQALNWCTCHRLFHTGTERAQGQIAAQKRSYSFPPEERHLPGKCYLQVGFANPRCCNSSTFSLLSPGTRWTFAASARTFWSTITFRISIPRRSPWSLIIGQGMRTLSSGRVAQFTWLT